MRVGLSAKLDGEGGILTDAELDAHLARCAGCRAWLDGAVSVSRSFRVRAVELPVDLVPGVMGRMADPSVLAHPARTWVRVALVVVAVTQIALNVPALLGLDAVGLHEVREVGASEIALAVGVLAAAWRPWRAAGMLPVIVALAVGLAGTTLVDVVGGAMVVVHEVPHLLALVEVALLWRLRHRSSGVPVGGTPLAIVRHAA